MMDEIGCARALYSLLLRTVVPNGCLLSAFVPHLVFFFRRPLPPILASPATTTTRTTTTKQQAPSNGCLVIYPILYSPLGVCRRQIREDSFFRCFPSLLVWSKTEEGTIKVPACRDWACSSKTGAKKREPVTAYLRYSLPVCLLIPPHRQVSLALVVGDGHGGAY